MPTASRPTIARRLDPAVHPGAGDVPDLGLEDSDCDGVDGRHAGAFFVSRSAGNDAGTGSREIPFGTIQFAIDRAAAASPRRDVYVLGGTYTEAITLRSGVSVYGGYAPSGARSNADTTSLKAPGGSAQTVLADGATGVELQLLEIRGPDRTGAGQSSYAIRAIDGAKLALSGVRATGGTAATGAAGAPGSVGSTGDNGGCGGLGMRRGPQGLPIPACFVTATGGAAGTDATAGGAGGTAVVDDIGGPGAPGTGPVPGSAGGAARGSCPCGAGLLGLDCRDGGTGGQGGPAARATRARARRSARLRPERRGRRPAPRAPARPAAPGPAAAVAARAAATAAPAGSPEGRAVAAAGPAAAARPGDRAATAAARSGSTSSTRPRSSAAGRWPAAAAARAARAAAAATAGRAAPAAAGRPLRRLVRRRRRRGRRRRAGRHRRPGRRRRRRRRRPERGPVRRGQRELRRPQQRPVDGGTRGAGGQTGNAAAVSGAPGAAAPTLALPTANAGQGDFDLDGTADAADACPAEPAPGGCQARPARLPDADGDAIPDGADACPAEAAGVLDGNGDGCPDIVPAVDRDRDGFSATQDCDDTAAGVNPRAAERPGNRIDENCDGLAAPFPRITAGVATAGASSATRTRFTRLLITEIPARGKVEVRCTASKAAKRACPFARRALRVRDGKASALSLLPKSRRKRGLGFGVGATLEVRITAPDHIGKVVRYRIAKGAFPRGKKLCLPPAAAKPERCAPATG